jgi:hypothetical protein
MLYKSSSGRRRTVKYFTWLFWTYAILKLIHLVLGSRGGADVRRVTVRERLVGGEPILFAVAFVLCVPVPLWIRSQLHRGYTHGFQLATDCYGRFAAGSALPSIRDKMGSWSLYEAAEGAESLAKLTGQLLNFIDQAVTVALSHKTHLYERQYAALAQTRDIRKVSEEQAGVRHCFKKLQDIEVSPPWL